MSDFEPKTPLGKKLLETRQRAIDLGMELKPIDELLDEKDATITRLERELEEWQRKSPFDTHIASYEVMLSQLEAENAALNGKVEKVRAKVDEVMAICPDLDEDRPYLGDVFDELKQILGEP